MVYRKSDVLIAGGGLAGLTCAIHLAQYGLNVALIEKKEYPFHRVCGEYMSNEILPYLAEIGIDVSQLNYREMKRFQLSAPDGNQLESSLPLGAISISRYNLDHFLYQIALKQGVSIHQGITVQDIDYRDNQFCTTLSHGSPYMSKIVIGSYGKRANLDRILKRLFFTQRSPYIGIKYHRIMDYPEDLVSLHNFQSGYCGVSMIENGNLNVCYLTSRHLLRKYKTIPNLEKAVLYQNPHLKALFTQSISVFNQPLVINEISFAPKSQVENHILMAGDAAGMITPLCGNGMAMAIRSAQILSHLIIDYFNGDIDRESLEQQYTIAWHKQFARRLFAGRIIQLSFQQRWVSNLSVQILKAFPGILTSIVKQTHGNMTTHDPVCHYTS